MTFSNSNPHSDDRSEAVVTCEPGRQFAVDLGPARQDYKEVMQERAAVQERGAARLVEVLRAFLDFGERFLGRIESNTYLVDGTYVVGDKFSAEHLRQALLESRIPYRRALISIKQYFKRQERLKADAEDCLTALRSTRGLYLFFERLQIHAGCRFARDPVDRLAQAQNVLRGFLQELEHTSLRDEIGLFVSADVLFFEHGISRSQLSRAKKKGLVDFKQAPEGFRDTKGRVVRILYNKNHALKHCSPRQKKMHAHGVVIIDPEEYDEE